MGMGRAALPTAQRWGGGPFPPRAPKPAARGGAGRCGGGAVGPGCPRSVSVCGAWAELSVWLRSGIPARNVAASAGRDGCGAGPRAERTLSPHDPPEAPITPPAPPPGPMEGAVPPPGCSAISGGGGARRERRWVKYDGIGPVDETGLPLASRSSVDRPRDWYRCMFQQIHCRLPEPEWDAQCCATAQPRSEPPAAPPALPNGTERTPWGDGGDTAEPGSVFAYEPGALNGAPHRGAGCAHRDPISPPQPPGAVPAVPPIEVQLQRELEQLSAELDEDIRAMERPQRRPTARSAHSAHSAPPTPTAPLTALSPHGLQSRPTAREGSGGSVERSGRDGGRPSEVRLPR